MKKLLLFSVCLSVALASCVNNKSLVTPDPTSSISASIDGTTENFNSLDSLRSIGGPNGVYFSGGNGTTPTSDRIAFYIISTKALTAGTYSSDSGSKDYTVQLFYEPGGTGANDYYYNEGAYNCTITVTSISGNTVQGTFSGTLILESTATIGPPKVKTITNGKFSVIAPQ